MYSFLRYLCAPKLISVNTTCASCEGIQTPVTVTGNSPLDIPNLLPENYTIEVFAVDTNNRKLENNSIIQVISVSTGIYIVRQISEYI